MAKLSVFNFITLNGYFAAPDGDTSWHRHGEEEAQYSKDSLASDNMLIFGRVTYEHMVAFWPTDQAKQTMPDVAAGMNRAEKIVFSRTLASSNWENTRIVSAGIEDEIKRLKNGAKDMTILGSGSIVTQLSDAGLVDEYEIMIDPVALGDGRPMFAGMKRTLNLELVSSRSFESGVVLHRYRLAKQ
jgi:dihydrofolate reductase